MKRSSAFSPLSHKVIFLDDREPAGIEAQVAPLADKVIISHLPVGDLVISDSEDLSEALQNGFVIERKTVGDLLASLGDRRLFHQAQALSEKARMPLLLVLGELHRAGQFISVGDCPSGWQYSSVMMALLRVQLAGIYVLCWEGELAEVVRLLFLRLSAFRQPENIARHVQEPLELVSPDAWVLCQLPGIGPQRASQLLQTSPSLLAAICAAGERYPNVRKFLGADDDLLQRVIRLLEVPTNTAESPSRTA